MLHLFWLSFIFQTPGTLNTIFFQITKVMASNQTVAVLQRIGSSDDGYESITLGCDADEVFSF
jgi:hypothetical protein